MSIGVVEINEHVTDSHELLSCADIACYAAKDRGRDTVVWFSPDDEEITSKSEMQWAPRIREGLRQNHFSRSSSNGRLGASSVPYNFFCG